MSMSSLDPRALLSRAYEKLESWLVDAPPMAAVPHYVPRTQSRTDRCLEYDQYVRANIPWQR